MVKNDVINWTCEDVRQWLINKGFSEYTTLFCDENEVDGEVLLSLTEQDLRTPPLEIKKLSTIKKLYNKIKELQHMHEEFSKKEHFKCRATMKKDLSYLRIQKQKYKFEDEIRSSSDSETSIKKYFPKECNKLLVSGFYVIVSFLWTAFTMVLVHERVPDKEKYPPLPDIVLDNLPLIPYAFKLTEVCGILLFVIFAIIILCHKHRCILLRRMCSIFGTVFLLRSVTMFVTSLSVPGHHLDCVATYYPSTWGRIKRAIEISLGLGMSLSGVQTCGDYMFSGHTSCLTLLNHFVTEYTPANWYRLHTASWILNLFGVFFILAAHEHYTLDVFVAFYISSRIFLYYHMLANTQSYGRSKRIKYLFPMFSYFESNVPGKVPHEWEVPFFSRFQACYNMLK